MGHVLQRVRLQGRDPLPVSIPSGKPESAIILTDSKMLDSLENIRTHTRLKEYILRKVARVDSMTILCQGPYGKSYPFLFLFL